MRHLSTTSDYLCSLTLLPLSSAWCDIIHVWQKINCKRDCITTQSTNNKAHCQYSSLIGSIHEELTIIQKLLLYPFDYSVNRYIYVCETVFCSSLNLYDLWLGKKAKWGKYCGFVMDTWRILCWPTLNWVYRHLVITIQIVIYENYNVSLSLASVHLHPKF